MLVSNGAQAEASQSTAKAVDESTQLSPFSWPILGRKVKVITKATELLPDQKTRQVPPVLKEAWGWTFLSDQRTNIQNWNSCSLSLRSAYQEGGAGKGEKMKWLGNVFALAQGLYPFSASSSPGGHFMAIQ